MTSIKQRAVRDTILTAAVRVAVVRGYRHMTRAEIAAEAGCSEAQVSAVLGTMVQLRRACLGAAIANEVLPVIAQGLAAGDPRARRAPREIQELAAASLVQA